MSVMRQGEVKPARMHTQAPAQVCLAMQAGRERTQCTVSEGLGSDR